MVGWRVGGDVFEQLEILGAEITGFDQLRDEALVGAPGEDAGEPLHHGLEQGEFGDGGGVEEGFALQTTFDVAFAHEVDEDRAERCVFDRPGEESLDLGGFAFAPFPEDTEGLEFVLVERKHGSDGVMCESVTHGGWWSQETCVNESHMRGRAGMMGVRGCSGRRG